MRALLVLLLCCQTFLVSACFADATAEERESIQKGIRFLTREVPSWARENKCFSCHNNGDAARALFLARRAGYEVAAEPLRETLAWLNTPSEWEKKKSEEGSSDKQLAAIQFTAALAGSGNTQALSKATALVARDQGSDGSWKMEGEQPTGSPAAYGTELATAMALLVLERKEPANKSALEKGRKWLTQRDAGNTVAAASILLGLRNDSSAAAQKKKDGLRAFLVKHQGSSGGWGPYPDAPPETFDTALALMALEKVGNGTDAAIRKPGRAFLLKEQQADGGWPGTTRPSGGESYAQRISTTAWALIALLDLGPI